MRMDVFKVTLAVGAMFVALLGWSIVTAGDRQHERAQASGLASTELYIKQMNCSMCRAEILHTLRETEGIDEVTPLRKGAVVAHDASQVAPSRLVRIVQGLGYEARLQQPQ